MSHDDALWETIRLYDATAGEYAEQWFDKPLREHLEAFASRLRKGARVLDAGGGHGRDARELSKLGLEPCIVDLSVGLLTEARKRKVKACALQGDLRRLPFPDSSFEGVWACASLVHLDREEISKALRELHRVATPEGILFVSLRIGKGSGWEPWKGGRRFYTYLQPHEALEKLKRSGWNVSWWKVENMHWFSALGKKK